MPPARAGQETLLREVILEFGRHLDILAEQLSASLTEADQEAKSVGDSFDELAAASAAIEAVACPEPGCRTLQDSCRRIDRSLQEAVVGLQYHDRLSQRLGLVRGGLKRLQSLLHEPAPLSYDTWLQSLRDLEQINRIEQQRLGPVPGSCGSRQARPAEDVELF